MFNFTAQYWKRLGDNVRDLFYKHVVKSGLDYRGEKFKKYSKMYAEKKAKGEYPRQSSTSTTPNLFLTGDMMREYGVTKFNKSMVQVGWLTEAGKVTGNAVNGRRIYGTDSQPFPPKIMSFIDKDITNYVFRQTDKYMKKNVEIKIDI